MKIGSEKCQKVVIFWDFLCKTVGATSLNFQWSPTEHTKFNTIRKPLKNTENHEKTVIFLIFLRSQPLVYDIGVSVCHSAKTVSIFSYVNLPDWLAKFCPFLTVLTKSDKTLKCVNFLIFLKTDKMLRSGSLLAVLLTVLPHGKHEKQCLFRGD